MIPKQNVDEYRKSVMVCNKLLYLFIMEWVSESEG